MLPSRRQLKSLKTCGVSSNWCVFSSELSYLLVSTGTLGNTLQPFSFRAGTMTKLAKFDGEMDYSWVQRLLGSDLRAIRCPRY